MIKKEGTRLSFRVWFTEEVRSYLGVRKGEGGKAGMKDMDVVLCPVYNSKAYQEVKKGGT